MQNIYKIFEKELYIFWFQKNEKKKRICDKPYDGKVKMNVGMVPDNRLPERYLWAVYFCWLSWKMENKERKLILQLLQAC